MKRIFWFLIFVAPIIVCTNAHAGLCALCRRSLETSQNAGLIKGFALSVFVIGGVPLVISAIIFFIFMKHRTQHLNQ